MLGSDDQDGGRRRLGWRSAIDLKKLDPPSNGGPGQSGSGVTIWADALALKVQPNNAGEWEERRNRKPRRR
ncbi:hypothetical protein V498_05369 [Pseudogymnoascus sp. VKM F-4517 (FW-2822)]|nr:hypothetical protein V498_05369 [Pseudogymnoascus sp. VKM F-4517 (FW-2822)]